MSSQWHEHGYEIRITEDQSPTLHWIGSDTQEFMHHCGGAFSETQLIYGNPLRESLKNGGRSAISVGLGLGYNEILTAVECLRHQISPKDFRLLSFESEDILRDRFHQWVQGQSFEIYDLVLSFFLKEQILTAASVKSWLSEALQLGTWKSEKALGQDVQISQKYDLIFYDAFSSKTSPHLWDEQFLVKFFTEAVSEKGMVSTYACLGNLKRALKGTGFQIIVREGFKSKRNSTLGIRRSCID